MADRRASQKPVQKLGYRFARLPRWVVWAREHRLLTLGEFVVLVTLYLTGPTGIDTMSMTVTLTEIGERTAWPTSPDHLSKVLRELRAKGCLDYTVCRGQHRPGYQVTLLSYEASGPFVFDKKKPSFVPVPRRLGAFIADGTLGHWEFAVLVVLWAGWNGGRRRERRVHLSKLMREVGWTRSRDAFSKRLRRLQFRFVAYETPRGPDPVYVIGLMPEPEPTSSEVRPRSPGPSIDTPPTALPSQSTPTDDETRSESPAAESTHPDPSLRAGGPSTATPAIAATKPDPRERDVSPVRVLKNSEDQPSTDQDQRVKGRVELDAQQQLVLDLKVGGFES